MSFKDLVNNSLRTKKQVEQDRINALNQTYEIAADYILGIIQNEILIKARNAEFHGTKISNTIIIPYSGNYSDSIPYGDIFETKVDFSGDRSGGIFSYRDTTKQKMEIRNIATLKKVFDLVRRKASHDDISISEPFILCRITDCNNSSKIKSSKKIFITHNKLSAAVTTTKRGTAANWRGEAAILSLAVDYIYSI